MCCKLGIIVTKPTVIWPRKWHPLSRTEYIIYSYQVLAFPFQGAKIYTTLPIVRICYAILATAAKCVLTLRFYELLLLYEQVGATYWSMIYSNKNILLVTSTRGTRPFFFQLSSSFDSESWVIKNGVYKTFNTPAAPERRPFLVSESYIIFTKTGHSYTLLLEQMYCMPNFIQNDTRSKSMLT